MSERKPKWKKDLENYPEDNEKVNHTLNEYNKEAKTIAIIIKYNIGGKKNGSQH